MPKKIKKHERYERKMRGGSKMSSGDTSVSAAVAAAVPSERCVSRRAEVV